MTQVATPTGFLRSPSLDPTPALLGYLSEVMGKDDPGPLERVLHELAAHFSARGAGVAYTGRLGFAIGPHAWVGDRDSTAGPPAWAEQIGSSTGRTEPIALEDGVDSWLLWCVPSCGAANAAVLWLNDRAPRQWSASETAAWGLTGQVLWRAGYLGGPPPTVERLAYAANIASRLSHDFGNVLTGILGFTELALPQVTAGTLAHRYLSEVWDVAQGGATWLKKVNFFCRRTPPEFTPTGLPGVLAAEEAQRGPAEFAAWRTTIPADLPAIACDVDSLREAVKQVLDNAREANAGHGTISIVARAVELDEAQSRALIGAPAFGRFVEIAITDQGPGLSEDARRRLFKDLFFSSKPRHRGLGLMMTYGVLHRFGGGLAISARDTGGTTVRLYLPAAADPVPAGPAQVLIVDEDPQVLAEARRVLEPAGYRLTLTSSSAEAMALQQGVRGSFDLLILSVHLSNLNGPELARRLLLRDPHAGCLFLYAPAGPPLPRDELLTADVLFNKPLTASGLLQAVAAVLRKRRRPNPDKAKTEARIPH